MGPEREGKKITSAINVQLELIKFKGINKKTGRGSGVYTSGFEQWLTLRWGKFQSKHNYKYD